MEGVQTFNRAAAESLVRWWRDAGVDTLVEEAPREWLSAAPVAAVQRVAERDGAGAAPLPAKSQNKALPPTLPELLAWMRDSADVPEARWGRTRLLPSGDPSSDVMILIDMPEPGDAAAGSLLAGSVGEMFDRMLGAIGRSRETVWLSSFATVRWVGRLAPPDSSRLLEIARHQIALVAPKRLLIMGQAPAEALIGPDWAGSRSDFHILNLGPVSVETVTTYTPGAMNKTPGFKKDAWRTLQLLMKGLT